MTYRFDTVEHSTKNAYDTQHVYLNAGEDLVNDVQKIERRLNYTNITTQATTTIKTGSGVLGTLTINTPVANAVITIYDNTAGSGTKIGTITLPAALVSDGPISLSLDLLFLTGLTLVTSGAPMDITVGVR